MELQIFEVGSEVEVYGRPYGLDGDVCFSLLPVGIRLIAEGADYFKEANPPKKQQPRRFFITPSQQAGLIPLE
jgi:hypothetical protein